MLSVKNLPSWLRPTTKKEHSHGRILSWDSISSTISNWNLFRLDDKPTTSSSPETVDKSSFPENSGPGPAADLYPSSPGVNLEEIKRQGPYRKVMVVDWIRHAQGFHNIGGEEAARSRQNIDARLTPKGMQQSQELAETIRKAPAGSCLGDARDKAQLIITSPVSRCVQTALYSLEPIMKSKPDLAVIAHEDIRETVNFNCDRRRPIHELAADFPEVDFSVACPNDEDSIWKYYEEFLGDDTEYTEEREQAEIHVVADRTRRFFEWLGKEYDKDHMIICCHATVSRCIFNYGHPGKTATDVPQKLDRRGPCSEDVPVINFASCDGVDASYMREDFNNCELRSMIVAFP